MDKVGEVLAAPGEERHLERRQGEVGPQARRDGPADYHPRERVDDEGDVGKASLGTHVGYVGDPEAVGGGRLEVAPHEVLGPLLVVRGHGGALGLAPDGTGDAELAHQPGDAVTAGRDAVVLELAPDLLGSIAAEVLLPDLHDEQLQRGVLD